METKKQAIKELKEFFPHLSNQGLKNQTKEQLNEFLNQVKIERRNK
ncbi:hypothetical protein KAI04_04160 [Candidatus Pacearchaeota archaeon]|nr:hypothetical protein [Candidatus Pacearchaeota archaeon]